MDKALEIADSSGKELDNLIAYKKITRNKRDLLNKLLLDIIDDNGRLNGYIKFIQDNQAKIQNQDAELDRLAKQSDILVNNRQSAFFSYKELAEE